MCIDSHIKFLTLFVELSETFHGLSDCIKDCLGKVFPSASCDRSTKRKFSPDDNLNEDCKTYDDVLQSSSKMSSGEDKRIEVNKGKCIEARELTMQQSLETDEGNIFKMIVFEIFSLICFYFCVILYNIGQWF